MSATTTTTISGVSLVARQRHRHRHQPVFELALSEDGVEVRQPGAEPQQITWDRVHEWELEVHRDGVMLTLRGSGAESALIVPGWTVAALDELLRDITTQVPMDPAPAATAPAAAPPATLVAPVKAPATSRVQRRRQRRRSQPSWKVVTALVLLGLVAAAVTVVLLQSAGVIHWAFLGPTG